jgi:hypothetical protein
MAVRFQGGKAVPVKQVAERITKDNFHLATEATFRLIAQPAQAPMKWVELMKRYGLFFLSDSGSQYVTNGTILWRASDHWGRVASCTWNITPGPVMNTKVTEEWQRAMNAGPLVGFMRHGPDPLLVIGEVPFSQMRKK